MRPIMFKFNTDRQTPFQTQTVIYQDEEGKVSSKKALTEEAKSHIKNLYQNSERIRSVYPQLYVGWVKWKGDELFFEYLEGQPLSHAYEQALWSKDRQKFEKTLQYQKKLILSCREDNFCNFFPSAEYCKIFGDGTAFLNDPALQIANWEMTSHNIILNPNNNTPGLIDYEYVFCFPLPVELLLYHCVVKTNEWTIRDFFRLMTREEILEVLDIKHSVKDLEYAWNNFDVYFGQGSAAKAKLQYLKASITVDNIREMKQELLGNQNYIAILTDNLGKQQAYIRVKEQEIEEQKMALQSQQRLLSQRETLLRQQEEFLKWQQDEIAKKQTEIEQMKQSLSWKLTAPLRKIADKFK